MVVARSYGIKSAADLGEEIKKWLPTKGELSDRLEPKLAPLQRTITEHIQPVRDAATRKFQTSELGRRMSERAQGSVKQKPPEPWEKEIVTAIEGKK